MKIDIERSITENFAEVVREFPDRIAVEDEERSLTYRELDKDASRLANWISSSRGESPVALLLSHSHRLIVGILAALKAGRIYIPLDPGYPRGRIQSILDDGQVELVITDDRCAHVPDELFRENDHDPPDILNVDRTTSQDPEQANAGEIDIPSADQSAYIIYTSGTTGRPNGVLQNHRNIQHFIRNYSHGLEITPDDQLSLLASAGFSASAMDIFAALLNGATLLPFDVRSQGITQLKRWLIEKRVSVYHSVPTLFRRLICSLDPDDAFPNLRIIDFGGEPVHASDVEAFRMHFEPGCTLVNGFGSTELNVISQYHIRHDADPPAARVPVGYPVTETEVLIDTGQRDQPSTDREGEIIIKSRYITPGYWRNPALTAERIRDVPGESGMKIFRTGDFGYFLPDGRLVHLGRIDSQVKIRGQRIEIAEVVMAMRSCRGVKEAAVIPFEDARGEQRLAGFLVSSASPAPDHHTLREQLIEKIPQLAIPAVLTDLPELPISSNGKLDVGILTDLFNHSRANQSRELDSRTPLPNGRHTSFEARLYDIWREVLDVEEIDRDDDWFSLGGDSLLAFDLFLRIGREWGVELQPAVLLESPSFQAMAEILKTQCAASDPVSKKATIDGTDNRFTGAHNWEDVDLQSSEPDSETAFQSISPAPRRLDPLLEGIWLQHQSTPESPRLNVVKAFQITGDLNVSALRQAAEEIQRRHVVLSSRFTLIDGRPHQIIDSGIPVEFDHLLLDEGTEPTSVAKNESQRPGNLNKAGQWRIAVYQTGTSRFTLVIVVHHIVCDARSIDILLQDLSSLYSRYTTAGTVSLEESAVEIRNLPAEPSFVNDPEICSQEHLEYWRERLSRVDFDLEELATEPDSESSRGTCNTFQREFPAELWNQLDGLAKARQTSTSTLLVAAYQALLARYTGSTHVIVGFPFTTRDNALTRSQVGYFVDLLPLVTTVDSSSDFFELLEQVRLSMAESLSHRIPTALLWRKLRPELELGTQSLCEAVFGVIDESQRDLDLIDLHVSPLPVEQEESLYPLNVTVRTRANHPCTICFEFDASRFSAASIERMSEHFLILLQSILTSPEKPLSELRMLSDAEQRRLLVTLNDTTVRYPHDQCIHHRFSLQADQHPGQLAVVDDREKLTYAQLDARSDAIARELIRRGVKANDCVGVAIERSARFVVAILGILKAGAAYLPLQIDDPRNIQLLREANVVLVLTSTETVSALQDEWPADGIVDYESTLADRQHGEQTEIPVVSAENFAYVMFTSGSTGVPKGVAVPHRAVIRLLLGTDFLPWSRDLRFLFHSAINFDAATLEIWGPLLHGGTCYVYSEQALTLDTLKEALARHRINCLWLTSALFNAIVDHNPDLLHPVRHLLVGGEPVSVAHIRKVFAIRSDIRILNGYGPTESTTFTSIYEIPDRIDEQARSIPIGKPIANTRVYILNRREELVPFGVPGELCIAGDGLACCYLGNEVETRKKFFEHSFDGQKRERFYRSGDRCRWREDGNLEFFGRLDRQIKIRGYRIEPGEIEAIIKRHPRIRDAAIICRQSTTGKQLFAFVATDRCDDATVSTLQRQLAADLPSQMHPHHWRFMKDLPRNASHKIDRKELCDSLSREQHHRDSNVESDEQIMPTTDTEVRLVQIWQELLSQSRVTCDDRFFESGGDSLAAVSLLARIEKEFGKCVKNIGLLRDGRLRDIAAHLDESATNHSDSIFVPISGDVAKPALYFLHSVLGDTEYCRNIARSFPDENPVIGIRADRDHSLATDCESFTCLARHYAVRLAEFQPEGNLRLAGFSWSGFLAYEVARQLRMLNRHVDFIAIIDAGPGRFQNKSRSEILSATPRFLRNLPRWVASDIVRGQRGSSAALSTSSAGAQISRIWSAFVSGQWSKPPLEALFDVSRIDRDLLADQQARIDLWRSYEPDRFDGQVVLFRAMTRPFFGTFSRDLGWLDLVDHLWVHDIPGNHLEVLRDRQATLIAKTILSHYGD